jgi:hypothetical protein
MSKIRRLRSVAVKDSASSLVKQSAKGVWMFLQMDILEDGSRKRTYFVYDVRQARLLTGDPTKHSLQTASFKEASADFRCRVEELSALRKSA